MLSGQISAWIFQAYSFLGGMGGEPLAITVALERFGDEKSREPRGKVLAAEKIHCDERSSR